MEDTKRQAPIQALPPPRRQPRPPPVNNTGLLFLASLLLLLTLALSLPASSSLARAQALSSSTGAASSAEAWNCSASDTNSTCIRIGVFYCHSSTVSPYPSGLSNAANCGTIGGYNQLIDWYRSRIDQELGGELVGVPVFFVPVRMSSIAPHSRTDIAALVDAYFFEPGTNTSLVDFVILPPGVAWDKAMLRLEEAGIPSIAGNSPLPALFQCASTTALLRSQPQPPCESTSTRRFQYAHGVSNGANRYMAGWVSLLQLRKVSTLGIITDAFPDALLSYDVECPSMTHLMLQPLRAGLQQSARDNSMGIIYDARINISLTYGPTIQSAETSPINTDRMREVVEEVRELGPDAVMLLTTHCSEWLKVFEEADYAPPSLGATFCDLSASGRVDADLTAYVVSSSQWSSNMTGSEYTESADVQGWSLFPRNATTTTSSPHQFEALWQTVTGNTTSTPSDAAAATLAAFSMLEGAINLAASVSPDLVNRQLQLYFQPSFFGLLTTNRYGINQQKQMATMQRSASDTALWEIVAPQSSADTNFIYPMPFWSDRAYHGTDVGRYFIEWLVLALVIVSAAMTVGLMVLLVRSRASTSRFYALPIVHHLVIGTGCLVAYASTMTWTVDTTTSSGCEARLWLWTIAFHVTIDPIMAVTYRMWRISRLGHRRRPKADAHTGVVVGAPGGAGGAGAAGAAAGEGGGAAAGGGETAVPPPVTRSSGSGSRYSVRRMARKVSIYSVLLFLPHFLLNLVWVGGFGGLSPSLVQSDPLRGVSAYMSCATSGLAGLTFLILGVIYCGVLLALSVVMSWRVRKRVVASVFSDARPVSLALVIFALTALVVLAVQLVLGDRNDTADGQAVLFALRSIGVLIAYQAAYALMIVPRLIESRRPLIGVAGGAAGGGAGAVKPQALQVKPLPAQTPAPLLSPAAQAAAGGGGDAHHNDGTRASYHLIAMTPLLTQEDVGGGHQAQLALHGSMPREALKSHASTASDEQPPPHGTTPPMMMLNAPPQAQPQALHQAQRRRNSTSTERHEHVEEVAMMPIRTTTHAQQQQRREDGRVLVGPRGPRAPSSGEPVPSLLVLTDTATRGRPLTVATNNHTNTATTNTGPPDDSIDLEAGVSPSPDESTPMTTRGGGGTAHRSILRGGGAFEVGGGVSLDTGTPPLGTTPPIGLSPEEESHWIYAETVAAAAAAAGVVGGGTLPKAASSPADRRPPNTHPRTTAGTTDTDSPQSARPASARPRGSSIAFDPSLAPSDMSVMVAAATAAAAAAASVSGAAACDLPECCRLPSFSRTGALGPVEFTAWRGDVQAHAAVVEEIAQMKAVETERDENKIRQRVHRSLPRDSVLLPPPTTATTAATTATPRRPSSSQNVKRA